MVGQITKCYKFSTKGLNNAIVDNKMDNINKWIDIGFWTIIIILYVNGLIQYSTLLNMIICSGTSRVFRWILK